MAQLSLEDRAIFDASANAYRSGGGGESSAGENGGGGDDGDGDDDGGGDVNSGKERWPPCKGSPQRSLACEAFYTNSFDMAEAKHGVSCAMYCQLARLNHTCGE